MVINMIYTIQASDDALGKEQLNKIYNKSNIQTDVMNTVEFDCLTTDIDQILDYCFTTPFFATHKVAVLRNPVFLTAESSKKDFTDFISKLMEYIENENSSTILIIYSLYDKLDERKKIVKFLKDKTKYIKVETPNAIQISDMVRKMVEKRNSTIDQNAIDLLMEKIGTNFVDIMSEVEKLTLFKSNDNISKKDVEDFVANNIDSSIFDLSNAILEKNVSKSITLFEDLTKGGLEPIALISVLSNQLRIALLAKSYQRVGLKEAEIAKKIKIHPYRVKLALRLQFSDNDLKVVLKKLADLDYRIKTGKVNKHHGMKLLILSI